MAATVTVDDSCCTHREVGGDALISIVIPCYNESANIDPLLGCLIPVLEETRMEWEIVFINDGSEDDTLLRLVSARKKNPRIRIISLSRRFGKEVALTAGLINSQGNAVIPMDADLQHPPEVIHDMLAKWRAGYEVVYAVRQQRHEGSLVRRWLVKSFYWFFDRLTGMQLPHEAGDFRLMDRSVVDIINQMPERNRFMKGIYAWVGFRQTGIPYVQESRSFGKSKWGIKHLLNLAFDGLTAFSNIPLRIAGGVGLLIAGGSFSYMVFRLVRAAIVGIDVPGYESTLVIILFMGGVQLITLGIMGDYIGRVFDEVKQRPLFIVREKYGYDDAEAKR